MTRYSIEVTPGVQFGRPCIGGTRIPAENIAEPVAAGDSVDLIADGFDLKRGQVLLACWYEIDQGEMSRSRGKPARAAREVWVPWAREHFEQMWRGEWDKVPDPPVVPR